MITFEDAYQLTMQYARPNSENEEVFLDQAVGRVLSVDVKTDRDIPPYHRVAMDGYACRKKDIGNELEVIDFIPAGVKPQKFISVNQCAKVMTGCHCGRMSSFKCHVRANPSLGAVNRNSAASPYSSGTASRTAVAERMYSIRSRTISGCCHTAWPSRPSISA